jgi:hypothetical protein
LDDTDDQASDTDRHAEDGLGRVAGLVEKSTIITNLVKGAIKILHGGTFLFLITDFLA